MNNAWTKFDQPDSMNQNHDKVLTNYLCLAFILAEMMEESVVANNIKIPFLKK